MLTHVDAASRWFKVGSLVLLRPNELWPRLSLTWVCSSWMKETFRIIYNSTSHIQPKAPLDFLIICVELMSAHDRQKFHCRIKLCLTSLKTLQFINMPVKVQYAQKHVGGGVCASYRTRYGWIFTPEICNGSTLTCGIRQTADQMDIMEVRGKGRVLFLFWRRSTSTGCSSFSHQLNRSF